MKTSLSILISIMPVMALADDPLPKRPDFNRYKAMLDRSPFAVATIAVPTATPDFAKDLYVANDARSDDGAFVTLASATVFESAAIAFACSATSGEQAVVG